MKRQLSVQRLAVGVALVLLLVLANIIVFVIKLDQSLTQEQEGPEAAQVEPVTPKGVEENEPEGIPEGPSEEQIVMEVVTGVREEMPPEMAETGMTTRTIIREYLSDCSLIKDLNEQLGCYELYYLNADPRLMEEKQECEALSGDERTSCLDQYYFKMGWQKRAAFCDAIMSESLRDDCTSIAI